MLSRASRRRARHVRRRRRVRRSPGLDHVDVSTAAAGREPSSSRSRPLQTRFASSGPGTSRSLRRQERRVARAAVHGASDGKLHPPRLYGCRARGHPCDCGRDPRASRATRRPARGGRLGRADDPLLLDRRRGIEDGRRLAGFDLERWRPWILVVEATKPNTTEPEHEAWEPRVLASGYCFTLFDGLNRFYVNKRAAGRLGHRLSYPACVFDQPFERFESAKRRRGLQRQLSAMEDTFPGESRGRCAPCADGSWLIPARRSRRNRKRSP